MMYQTIHSAILACLQNLQKEGQLAPDVTFNNVAVEQPREAGHGDFFTNAAMVLAKPAKTNSRALAALLLPMLEELEMVEAVEIAGPGFINITLTPEALLQELTQLIENPKAYASPNVGQGTKVLVEFVSINPTGPIHVGHGRNAVLGDALCRLLEKTNHKVFREYLVNDAGNQIRSLVFSVHARYKELFGQPLELPEDGYVGEYIIDIAEALKAQDGDKWVNENNPDVLLKELRIFCVEACMDMIRADLNKLDIRFDNFHSEYAMHEAGDPLAAAVATLRAKGFVYEGTLPPPKGKTVEDYEPAELTLFKATEFGAEVDKPIYNRTGQPTYFGQDIAYHQDKLNRAGGQDKLVTVIASQQRGNFTPLVWALEALTGRKDTLHPMYYELVKALRNGQPVKLSKRAGNIVALCDVLDEVGNDAFRFHMLTRKSESELVFDLAKAVEKSMENPVFYVQYAHARCASVFRQAEELALPDVAPDISALATPAAREVLGMLMAYPNMLEKAAVAMEPHRLAFYAQDLAASLHSWYNVEKFLEQEAPAITHMRLQLVKAVQIVLADVLATLGISAPQSM